MPGHRHDTAALTLSNVLDTLDPGNWIGDKGYIGNGMITPIRKPACRNLLAWEKQFNRDVNKTARARRMIPKFLDRQPTRNTDDDIAAGK